jgi:hypothetical protein
LSCNRFAGPTRALPHLVAAGFVATLMMVFFATPVFAAYKCVDDTGKVTYQDDICPKGANEKRIDADSRRDRTRSGPSADGAATDTDPKAATPAAPAKPRDADEAGCTPMEVNDIDAERTRNAARVAITMRMNGPNNVRFEQFVHARLKCADGMREMACGKASTRNSQGRFDDPKVWLFALTPESYLTWSEDENSDPQNAKRMGAATAACFKFGT